jgi:hypothetical protein
VLPEGIEPTRPIGQEFLRLRRLPFRHGSISNFGATDRTRTYTSLRTLHSKRSAAAITPQLHIVSGANEGSRTLMGLRPEVFETSVSAIPPHWHVLRLIYLIIAWFSSFSFSNLPICSQALEFPLLLHPELNPASFPI